MTPNREDYLKLILELGGDQKKINNKQIVSGLDVFCCFSKRDDF